MFFIMQTGLQRFASFWSTVMKQSRLRPNIILVAFGNKILRNAFWILLVGHIFFSDESDLPQSLFLG